MVTKSTKENKIAPFFIVGSGRSGSTLLRMILASHSRIAIPPETWFIIPLAKQIPINLILTKHDIDKAVGIITSHYRWPDMGIDRKELSSWVKDLHQPRLKDIIDLVYNHHLLKEKKLRWGDKTPPYIKIVPELAVMYPEAKFIYIVRDGRDVTKSFQDKKWFGKWLYKNTSEWKESVLYYNSYKKSNLAGNFFEVKYEDLILNLDVTTRNICNFIGENFEPEMLFWEQHLSGKIPKREIHIHEKLFRRPKQSDVRRWENGMSFIEVLVTESFIGQELISAGYDTKFKGLLWKSVFSTIRLCCCFTDASFLFLRKILSPVKRCIIKRVGLAGKSNILLIE